MYGPAGSSRPRRPRPTGGRASGPPPPPRDLPRHLWCYGPALLPGKPSRVPAAPAAFRAERGTLLIPASSSLSRALCFSHLIRTYPPPIVTLISILPISKHVLVPPGPSRCRSFDLKQLEGKLLERIRPAEIRAVRIWFLCFRFISLANYRLKYTGLYIHIYM